MSRRTPAAVALGAVLLLAACQGEAEPGTQPSDTADTANAADSRLTPPGTTLHLGDSATVPIGDTGIARLTVTRIEEGTAADLEKAGHDAKASVSYVWFSVAPVAGDISSFAYYRYIHGWSGDDLVPYVVTDPKPFAPCPTRYFPGGVPSGVLETCTAFTNTVPIDRVSFHDAGDYIRNEDEIFWQ